MVVSGVGADTMTTKLEADYLVVGAGAMGMAFTDVLVAETDATVIMVDRHHQPGGHWTTAYPYVRLHQPSKFYGVNSRPLGSDTIDHAGWNEGLYELATCGEVCAYFDQVMQQHLLPSGRVSYYPMSEYQGDGRFRSQVSGAEFQVTARRRIVDATYMRVTVPSMRPPPYGVAAGAQCVAPNELPRLRARHERYVVVGAGKTGMDACLWLLGQGVRQADISWIMPRDSWILDRARIQPGSRFARAIGDGLSGQAQAIDRATSIDDLFDALETCGQLLRIDPDVWPRMYRCATVSRKELAALRTIKDIVRLGRVQRIDAHEIVLDDGRIPTTAGTLHIDCTADGLARKPATPVFAGERMNLQSVRTCQQVFSAAFIGHVEAAYCDDETKNRLCSPVPHPDSDLDWLRDVIADGQNALRWSEDESLRAWLRGSRLDVLQHLGRSSPAATRESAESLRQLRAGLAAQQEKLSILLGAAGSASPASSSRTEETAP